MELRQYWNVIWRRRWIVLAVIASAFLFSLFSLLTAGRTYELEAVFTVRYPQSADQTNGNNGPAQPIVFNYEGYYYYLSSEYQVDDFTQLVETDAFGAGVIKVMQERFDSGQTVVSDTVRYRSDIEKLKSQDIVALVGSDRRHRELRIFVVAPTRDLAANIIDAAGIVLTEARYELVRGRFDDRPIFGQWDRAGYDKIESSTSKEITNALTRVIMGIVAALAIAFLLEYLDNSVRDERDAQRSLELPVIGAIPRT